MVGGFVDGAAVVVDGAGGDLAVLDGEDGDEGRAGVVDGGGIVGAGDFAAVIFDGDGDEVDGAVCGRLDAFAGFEGIGAQVVVDVAGEDEVDVVLVEEWDPFADDVGVFVIRRIRGKMKHGELPHGGGTAELFFDPRSLILDARGDVRHQEEGVAVLEGVCALRFELLGSVGG